MTHLLDSLKQIINRHEAPDDEHATPRAAAILLIELAATDEGGDAAELRIIERAIRDHFGLAEREVDELLAEAGRLQRQSVSLHDFTRQLRAGLKPEGRSELVEWLWRVAYADGRLGHHEEHMIRRISDLLGVPHREF